MNDTRPEDGLRLTDDLGRHLFDQSPQALVAVAGPAHVLRAVNPAFARLVGKPADELVGRPFAEAVPEGGGACVALLDRVFRTGVSESLAEQEHRPAAPAFWSYALWATLGRDGRPTGVMVQVTDSTETALFRRRAVAMNEALVLSAVRQHELIEAIHEGEAVRRGLEAQRLQAQKLESLGVLAGGIAHDLNNILTPILGFAELARHLLAEDSPAAPLLDDVAANARRAADLVQQILAYAGRGQLRVQALDPSDLVRGVAGLFAAAAAVSPGVELRYELTPGLPAVAADPAQLRQVVLNLVTNAAEATAGAGVVTVRTLAVAVAPGTLWSAHATAHLPAGRYAAVEVADAGCGMTPEVAARVFDPFFTTKFVGRGLGLAAAQGIAHGHGGVLQVETAPGRGSTFRLLLPGATTPAPPR